jgi:hypothetical protein
MAYETMPQPGDPIQLGEFLLEDRRFSAVYFLFCGGRVVYVGQSRTLKFRIDQHLEEGAKEFDAVAFIRCTIDRLTEIEGYYIRHFVPKYNDCAIAKKSRQRESWKAMENRRRCPWSAPQEFNGEIKTVDAATVIVPPETMGDFLQVRDGDVDEWRADGLLPGDMSIVDMLYFVAGNSRKVRQAQERFEQI